MLFSIITPIYNSEKFLKGCIQSVIRQENDDFELILIDDGSTDGSLEICKEFQEMDERIRVFHQENQGVSSARNTGLKNAKGKWITFLDSDDLLLPYFLSEMKQDILKHPDADLIYQNTIHRNENMDSLLYQIKENYFSVHDFYLKNFVSNFGYAHSKCYRRSIINENRMMFDSKVNFAEDCLFMVNYLTNARQVYLSEKANYIYQYRENSLVSKTYRFVQEQYLYQTMKKALKRLFNQHQLPNSLYVRELEYPLRRMMESNNRISSVTIRLANYEQMIQESSKGMLNLIQKPIWKHNLVENAIALDIPEILDEVVKHGF